MPRLFGGRTATEYAHSVLRVLAQNPRTGEAHQVNLRDLDNLASRLWWLHDRAKPAKRRQREP